MNTTKLKRFATEARNKLRQGVEKRLAMLGFDDAGVPAESPKLVSGGAVWKDKPCTVAFYNGFKSLEEQIRRYGVSHVVEEAAYTWFNRLMAIRILTMNELCEPVLRYVGSTRTPLIVDEARQGHLPEMDTEDREALMTLIDDDTKTAEQFALLISAFCHNTPLIAKCFSLQSDYTDVLFPANILAENGFIDTLNTTDFITEEDYHSSELLGWLYQFYISEKKDQVFAKKGKYDADDIPAATQIFTPNWIVKYMVQNTIGGVLGGKDKLPENQRKYYVDTPEPPKAICRDIEELKVADLACGSGHILNECFDLLYDLYISEGYTRREAIECIFTQNLTGIDIDTRAKQLATFALMLKACQRDSSLVDASLMPHVYDMSGMPEESRELGSIQIFDEPDSDNPVIAALSIHYDAIVMNPPYMGGSSMSQTLSNYVKTNYPKGKSDLATVFVEAMPRLTKEGGKYAFIIPPSWMFLSGFESLRKTIIENQSIDSLLHLSRGIFGADFGSSSAVITNEKNPDAKGNYFRLIERTFQEFDQSHLRILFEKTLVNPDFRFKFREYTKDVKEIVFSKDGSIIYYPCVSQKEFKKIPGIPFAYWVSDKIRETFTTNLPLSTVASPCVGLQTADNGRFVRSWFEVAVTSIGFGCESASASVASGRKFFPLNKGGSQRKWYGDQGLVVNWENNGEEIKAFPGAVIRNPDYYFRECIGWSDINSGKNTGFKYFPKGFIFEVCGRCCFDMPNQLNLLGVLNTPFFPPMVKILNPTIHFQVGDFKKLPYMPIDDSKFDSIVKNCIEISKTDWDAHETSWDFEKNPLLAVDDQTYMDNINAQIEKHRKETGETLCIDPAAPQLDSIKWRFEQYCQKWESLFMKLHANEEELNRRFIEIYGLQDELTPDVPLNEVTILQQGEVSLGGQASLPVHSAEKDTRRHLPHRVGNGTLQHITFRLADSLPQSVLSEYKSKKDLWLANHPQPWDENIEKEYHTLFSHKMDEYLDNGYGSCILRQPEIADILENAIKFHDGKKYNALAYVIMPNHVHLLVEVDADYSVSSICHSIKSYTANMINKELRNSGPLWMEESFDREIRNEDHYNNVVRYIWKNFRSGGVRLFDKTTGGEACRKDRQGCLSSQLIWHPEVVMKQFISYAVGCMMGRYRLDRPGLAIAHPNETPEEVAEYLIPGTDEKFWIDDDGIIPLMPEDCGFHDNAVNRFATFVRQTLGDQTQIENLNFIEECLGKSLEQYFIKDFWKDHKKMYQNRPIYWLFASKKGAFQVLVYVHRMNVATVERIRSRYLLPYIERLNKRIEDLQANESTLSTKQRNQLKTLRAQVAECEEYHNRLAVVAERGIVPNLDDGILKNHALYGDIVTKLK